MNIKEKINNGRELKKTFEPSNGGIGKILYMEQVISINFSESKTGSFIEDTKAARNIVNSGPDEIIFAISNSLRN